MNYLISKLNNQFFSPMYIMFALMGNCMKWANGKKESRKSVTIIAVGLDNAGKTTTVHGVKGYATDDVTPTMGFSSVDLSSGKFNVKIFDLGGGARIRDIWQSYMAEAHAVIFVIDSSDVSRMDECRVAFERVVSDSRISGKPILILANKQDKPGAIEESELCDRLNLEEVVNVHQCPSRVEHCTALPAKGRRKPKKLDRGIKTGFAWLLDVIGSEYDVLHERISRDVQEQKEREAEERVKRIERVRKIREERERREKEGIQDDEVNRSQPDGISSHIEGNDHELADNSERMEHGIQDPEQNTLAELGKEALAMSHNQETGLGWELANDDESDANVSNKNIIDDEPTVPPPLPGAVNIIDPIESQEESNNRVGSAQSDLFEKSGHPDSRSLSKASLREIIQETPTPHIYELPGIPTYQTPTKSTLGSVVNVEKDDQSDDAVITTELSQPKPKKKRRKKKRRHNKIDVLQSTDNLNETDHPRPLPGRLTPLKIGTNGGNVKDDAFGTIQ